MADVRSYVQSNRESLLRDLGSLIRIPSVSTLPEHAGDIRRAAEWIADHLGTLGFTAEVIPAGAYPLVYAEWLGAGPGAPTLLCYGHVDVQPVDPLDEWRTPPFEPTVRGDHLCARGASDDKGQLMGIVKACEAHLRTSGRLPVNVKFIIESEEEVAGTAVIEYVREHPDRLRATAALVCDGSFYAKDLPTITTGLRGMTYTQVHVETAAHDMHSGQYGGAAPNPFQALAWIIAGLKTGDGRVHIPGFYDRVRAPSDEERASWARLPFDEAAYFEEMGATGAPGEQEYTILERRWARPTFEVHGVPGGFVGPGAKTVIPARASAKISMRLVPDQDPFEVFDLFGKAVRERAPSWAQVRVELLNTAQPVLAPPDSPAVRAAARALRAVFGKDPVYAREGGSVPVVAAFSDSLKIPTVLMGFGLPDDNLHAPNERFYLPNYYGQIETVAVFLEELARG